MSGKATNVLNDSSFLAEINNAGPKLIVIDFYATWCDPCTRVGPIFEQLAAKYSKAIFLKVDVDKCPQSATSQQVTAMPTFVFLQQNARKDVLRGADPSALEEKIKKWYGTIEQPSAGDEAASPIKGYIDLAGMIMKNGCECLNESDEHPLTHALNQADGFLQSDCDEQLIIALEFNQKVKLHSLRIDAPADKGPKTIKLFVNQPNTLDFDKAESREPIQTINLTPQDLEQGNVFNLKLVKLQHVENVNLFVKDNQTGNEVTQIDFLTFIGNSTNTTNMSEFKRIAGKKGESH